MGNSYPSRNAESAMRVLLLNDGGEGGAIERQLSAGGYAVRVASAQDEAGLTRLFETLAPAAVVAQTGPDSPPPARILELLRQVAPGTPFIVAGDQIPIELVVQCVRAGADSVVQLSELERLPGLIAEALSIREPLRALSPRQRDVFRRMVQGHSMSDIASHLDRSVKTVETHRSEIIRRLGIRDTAGLVRYALRTGVVAVE